MIEIKVIDNYKSRIIRGVNQVKPCLSYDSEYVKQGQYRVIKKKYRKTLINKQGIFLTGFIPKIKIYAAIHSIPTNVIDNRKFLAKEIEPHLNNRDLTGKYSYQMKFIEQAIYYQRGVIKSATASGKTTMMLGIISCFPLREVLFLSNSYTPIKQFEKACRLYLPEDFDRITISTIQSFYRKNISEYRDKFDIIIIDEIHEGGGSLGSYKKEGKRKVWEDSMYNTVLKNSNAIMRFGFTATLPDSQESKLILEGLIGPVICELTIEEGTKIGVLAKPKIILQMLPENSSLKDMKWRDAYNKGIVNNRALNRMIVTDAINDVESGESVLILVKEIKHGGNIVDMAKRLYDFDITFVNGSVESDVRERIRLEMIDKEKKCIVATAVFKKALDIPNLGVVINGAGGKTECGTIQAIGRGARRPEGKDSFIVRDYFNPNNRYLIEHFGRRECLYFKEGWK